MTFWLLFPAACVTLWLIWQGMDLAAGLIEKWWTSS